MSKEPKNTSDIEKAKQEAKEHMAKSIDAYFERFLAAKNGKLPSIDEIETMWGDEQSELNQILAAATNKLAEQDASDSKKKLPSV